MRNKKIKQVITSIIENSMFLSWEPDLDIVYYKEIDGAIFFTERVRFGKVVSIKACDYGN